MKRFLKTLCCLVAVGALFPLTNVGRCQVAVQDSLALVALYDSTNGPNWKRNDNWLRGPVSTWYGVTVSGGRVTEITLNNNGSSGKSVLLRLRDWYWLRHSRCKKKGGA